MTKLSALGTHLRVGVLQDPVPQMLVVPRVGETRGMREQHTQRQRGSKRSASSPRLGVHCFHPLGIAQLHRRRRTVHHDLWLGQLGHEPPDGLVELDQALLHRLHARDARHDLCAGEDGEDLAGCQRCARSEERGAWS